MYMYTQYVARTCADFRVLTDRPSAVPGSTEVKVNEASLGREEGVAVVDSCRRLALPVFRVTGITDQEGQESGET